MLAKDSTLLKIHVSNVLLPGRKGFLLCAIVVIVSSPNIPNYLMPHLQVIKHLPL